MTQEVLKLALEFIENSECGTADLEARIKEALAQTQEPFEDLATELFVVAQISPADDGFSDTIERIGSWLQEHFSTPPQRTEQLKACVYCGQLVAKEKNT